MVVERRGGSQRYTVHVGLCRERHTLADGSAVLGKAYKEEQCWGESERERERVKGSKPPDTQLLFFFVVSLSEKERRSVSGAPLRTRHLGDK